MNYLFQITGYNMSGIKLQINSLEALERINGGESEIEVELRSSIVQEFSKRHLKHLSDGIIIQTLTKDIKEYIDTEYRYFCSVFETTYMKQVSYGSRQYVLKPEIIETIKKEVDSQLKSIAFDYISSDATIALLKKNIEEKLLSTASKIELELADIVLNKRIDDLVNKKIKERLGV